MKQRKKKKNFRTEVPTMDQIASQAANDWQKVDEVLPPFNKIITVKLKSGTIVKDCARIPDMGDNYYYVQGEGKMVYNVTEWKNEIWKYPNYAKK